MSMPKFYAVENVYGSETSVGFDNTNRVLMFYSKALRDKYVAEHNNGNISIRAISRKTAHKYADCAFAGWIYLYNPTSGHMHQVRW
jgi:hypothetical protein